MTEDEKLVEKVAEVINRAFVADVRHFSGYVKDEYLNMLANR